MTNGNVHPLKNRMKVNIFSFYAASVQLILIQLAMSTRTKFEIRHRIYLQSNSSLYLTRLSLQNHITFATYVTIIYYLLCYYPLGNLEIICCTNIIYSNHNIRLFENQRICLNKESNASWRKFISKSLHTCNLSNAHTFYNVLSSLRG